MGAAYEDGVDKSGHGLQKDLPEAIRWYRKAANQGSEFAKQRLVALNQSDGTTQSRVSTGPVSLPGKGGVPDDKLLTALFRASMSRQKEATYNQTMAGLMKFNVRATGFVSKLFDAVSANIALRLPLIAGVLNSSITRPSCAVPRASVARTASD